MSSAFSSRTRARRRDACQIVATTRADRAAKATAPPSASPRTGHEAPETDSANRRELSRRAVDAKGEGIDGFPNRLLEFGRASPYSRPAGRTQLPIRDVVRAR